MSTTARLTIVGVSVASAAVGAVVTWVLTRPAPPTPPPTRALAITLRADRQALEWTIAPDGGTLVYVAIAEGRARLYRRPLDRFASEPIAGTDGATQPFFSPDSAEVAFFADGRLKRVALSGSEAIEIALMSGAPVGGSWGPDGRIVFGVLDGEGLRVVGAGGGTIESLTTLDDTTGERAHGWPRHFADGRRLVFTTATPNRDPRLVLLDVESGERQRLVLADGGGQVVGPDTIVYSRRGEAFALQLDPDDRSPRGGPRPLFDGVRGSAAGHRQLGRTTLAATGGGTLVYTPEARVGAADNLLVWVDRQGDAEPVDGVAGPHQVPRLSSDGTLIAFARRSDVLTRDLWVHDIDAAERRQVTRHTGDNHSPRWSVHGRALTFASSRGGPQRLYRLDLSVRLDLSTRPDPSDRDRAEVLLDGDGRTPGGWSADTLYFHQIGARSRDVWRWRNGLGEPVVATDADERSPTVSPDGEWLAFVSDTAGGDDIYVQPLPAGTPVRVSAGGGSEPVWSRDGAELFFRHGRGLWTLPFDADGPAGPSRRLFDGGFLTDPGGSQAAYDVDADGRFLMLRPAVLATEVRIVTGLRIEPRTEP
jgi:Tol biopolymer transport system component